MGVRVYVSSTLLDLKVERQTLAGRLRHAGYEVVMCEDQGSRAWPVPEACSRDVQSCEIYVLLLGTRYGYRPPGHGGKSITQIEYEAARSKPVRLIVAYESRESAPGLFERLFRSGDVAALGEFRRRVDEEITVGSVPHAAETAGFVLADLIQRDTGLRRVDGPPPSRVSREELLQCDRTRVYDRVRPRLRDPADGRPIVAFAYGEADEGHSLFAERLARVDLRAKAPVPVSLPEYVLAPEDAVADMHRRVAEMLLPEWRETPDDRAVHQIARYPEPMVVEVNLPARPWSGAVRAAVRAYCRSWFEQPLVTSRSRVVVLLQVVGSGVAVETELAETAEPDGAAPLLGTDAAGRTALLGLTRPERQDVVTWAGGVRRRLDVPNAVDRVVKLYGERSEWPMQELFERLQQSFLGA